MTTHRTAWLVNPFDPVPGSDHRPMRYEGFADALGQAGWSVTWFTADFDHGTRRHRIPADVDRVRIADHLRIEYIHVPPYHATLGPARLVSHRRYTRGLRPRMQALAAERPDLLLVSLPLADAVRAALEHRAAGGGAVVVDVQDVWPEALHSVLPAPLRPAYAPLRRRLARAETRLVAAADGVIAVSETYLRERAPAGSPQHRAYLGIDLDAFDAALCAASVDLEARPSTAQGRLTVLWTGSIRPAADLATVIGAAARLRDRRVPVRFLIAGDGPERGALEAHAARHRLGPETLEFLGAFPESLRPALVRRSHVGLNAYAAGCANSVTNKLFDYQAAGLAIVNSIPGEVADLVCGHDMGCTYRAGNAESLAAVLAALAADPDRTRAMGRAARRFVERHGARSAIAADVAAFLDHLAPASVARAS
jgi:glycosyltransferase involved in cell wall biosynthesis